MKSLIRNRWVRRIGVVAALLVVVVLAGVAINWALVRKAGVDRRDMALAELDATDPGWRTVDLEAAYNAAIAPPGQNAGEQALAAYALLTPEYKVFDGTANWRSMLDLPHLPFQDDLADLRAHLADVGPALDAARAARNRPGGGFRWAFKEPDLIGTRLPGCDQSRGVASLLDWSALLEAAADQPDRALDAARAILALDRGIGDQPTLIAQLVRYALLAIAGRSVERTLAWSVSATEPALAEVQADLLRVAELPRLKAGFRGERAITFRILENLESGALTPGAAIGLTPEDQLKLLLRRRHWPGQQADALGLLNRLVAVADLPSEDRAGSANRIAQDAAALANDPNKQPMSILVSLMLPAAAKVIEADHRTVGVLRATAAAVACERHRLKTGAFPAVLADLPKELLAEVPNDPFTGKPILFRSTADGVVVYCTGADGSDDGGVLKPGSEPGFDIGVRLYHPKHRRKPPVEP